MPCNTLVEPACRAITSVISSAVESAATGVLNAIARDMSNGIRWVVQNTAAWWIHIGSPDLASESAVGHLQQWLLPVTAAVAVGAMAAAGLRMAITRRASPLLDLSGGLLTIAATTALGATTATLLLQAGDAWSQWVLQESTGGHFTRRLIEALNLGGKASPVVVLIFGTIAILLGLVQAVLMLFRQIALIILAGVLPLAAAGSIAPVTRTWIRKVSAWMLALICYKPAAAAVYAAAFTLIGSGSSSRTVLMGFAMLALSVVMLPALMRFFTWTTGSVGGGGGGGGGFLGTAAMGAMAVGAMRSAPSGASSAAQDQASYLSSRLGPPPGGGSPPTGAAPWPGPAGSGGSSGPADGAPRPAPASASSASTTFPSGPAPGTAPSGTVPSSSAAPSGAAAPAGAAPSGGTAASAGAQAGGPAATTTGATAADATATGAAAAAGPAGAAAAAGAQAAKRGTDLAAGAMESGDDE